MSGNLLCTPLITLEVMIGARIYNRGKNLLTRCFFTCSCHEQDTRSAGRFKWIHQLLASRALPNHEEEFQRFSLLHTTPGIINICLAIKEGVLKEHYKGKHAAVIALYKPKWMPHWIRHLRNLRHYRHPQPPQHRTDWWDSAQEEGSWLHTFLSKKRWTFQELDLGLIDLTQFVIPRSRDQTWRSDLGPEVKTPDCERPKPKSGLVYQGSLQAWSPPACMGSQSAVQVGTPPSAGSLLSAQIFPWLLRRAWQIQVSQVVLHERFQFVPAKVLALNSNLLFLLLPSKCKSCNVLALNRWSANVDLQKHQFYPTKAMV